jgi:hypothetical protein
VSLGGRDGELSFPCGCCRAAPTIMVHLNTGRFGLRQFCRRTPRASPGDLFSATYLYDILTSQNFETGDGRALPSPMRSGAAITARPGRASRHYDWLYGESRTTRRDRGIFHQIRRRFIDRTAGVAEYERIALREARTRTERFNYRSGTFVCPELRKVGVHHPSPTLARLSCPKSTQDPKKPRPVLQLKPPGRKEVLEISIERNLRR